MHEEARRVAYAARGGRPAPEYHVLRESARGALNRLYRRSRDRAAFLAAPKAHPSTADAYYGRAPEPTLFERLRERLGRCLTNLLDQPLWDDLAELPESAVRVVDDVATVVINSVPVYVAPDLLFRTPRTGWTVVDWKTGSGDGAEAQLALAGLLARNGFGLPAHEGGYEGWVIDLSSGRTAVHHLDAGTMTAAEARVADGVRGMHAYLRDVRGNVPLPPAAYPVAGDRRTCAACPFRELCAAELE